ncbi:MAG: S8 family serine peptidase, partial [Gammaproteobacteria bacterium]
KAEQWHATGIVATVPASLKAADTQATLVLRDARTSRFVGNRLMIRFCPEANVAARQQPQTSGPQPAQPPGRSDITNSAGVMVPADKPLPPLDDGDSDDVEAQETIVFSKNMDEARRLADNLEQLGYRIKRRRELQQLGMVISVVRLPDGVTVRDGLAQIRKRQPGLIVDANHRYQLMSDAEDQGIAARQLVKWGKVSSGCGKDMKLGLVDTLVEKQHPALAAGNVITRSFLPLGMKAADKRHATAIASILVGRASKDFATTGLLPAARLYNAGIFRRRGDEKVDTTAELIIAALDWLKGQRVSVINLSLAGNSNQLLRAVIESLANDNLLLTAAAGNNGPDAPQAYPAAWPGVVAVTAVDIEARIFLRANRGDYIDVAAPGVDIWAARPDSEQGAAYYSGTSFAVPYVTAALAVLRQRDSTGPAPQLVQRLQRQIKDLGAPGKDPVYGFGLLQVHGACN